MKRLDIKIENLVKLIEKEEKLRLIGEDYYISDFCFNSGLFNDLNAFLRTANKIGEGQYGVCYEKDGLIFKISKIFLEHYHHRDYGNVICPDTNVQQVREYSRGNLAYNYLHLDKMERLMESKKRHNFIYNSLPISYINFGNGKYTSRIGVIYTYHKDYKSIDHLVDEDLETIINVLVNIGNCQKELIDAGIFYNDFSTGNILYKNSDVKIIDFDIPNPEFYNSNDFDELISFKRQTRYPEYIKKMNERNDRLLSNSYEFLMTTLQTIIDKIFYNELQKNPFELEDYLEVRKTILEKTIIQRNSDGLLDFINKYIHTNKKNRTR